MSVKIAVSSGVLSISIRGASLLDLLREERVDFDLVLKDQHFLETNITVALHGDAATVLKSAVAVEQARLSEIRQAAYQARYNKTHGGQEKGKTSHGS